MNDKIARDLSHKLHHDLAAVLERQVRMAGVVLEPADLAALMLEAGVMMVRTVSATIAGMAEDEAGIEQLFDRTVEQITAMVAHSRSDDIARAIGSRGAG